MQKSYRKNILREMKGNASRMVSLFGIVMLGVMMLTGLMSFAPSMRNAGQKYYVQQNVFDLRVLSTLGLSEEDIAAIAATEGVEAVMPVKYLDTEAGWEGEDEAIVVRLQQLPADPEADTDANMNRLVLRSGRMPEAADECVVHVMGYQTDVELGTVLTLPDETDGTKHRQYTVVGLVQDPQHISTDKESSTIGTGELECARAMLHVVQRRQLGLGQGDAHNGVLVHLHACTGLADCVAQSLDLLDGQTAGVDDPHSTRTLQILLDRRKHGLVLCGRHCYTSFFSNSGSAPCGWSRA